MKYSLLILISLGTILASADQGLDQLLKKTLILKSPSIDKVLAKTETNIKVFADNFNVRLDSGSKIVAAKKVGGTLLQPVLNITIRKCVFLFCQTIDLDAEFDLKVVNGTCDLNYELNVDLRRSSQMLTDLYSNILTQICIKKNATGATAALQVDLIHASTYQAGIVQKQAFNLISLQGQSLLETFKSVMMLNGVTEIQ